MFSEQTTAIADKAIKDIHNIALNIWYPSSAGMFILKKIIADPKDRLLGSDSNVYARTVDAAIRILLKYNIKQMHEETIRSNNDLVAHACVRICQQQAAKSILSRTAELLDREDSTSNRVAYLSSMGFYLRA